MKELNPVCCDDARHMLEELPNDQHADPGYRHIRMTVTSRGMVGMVGNVRVRFCPWCGTSFREPAPTETASSDLYVPFVRGDRPESIRLSTILDAIKGHPKLLAATRAALTETNPHTGSRLSSAVTRVEIRCDGPACRGRLIVLQPETAPTETKCTCKGHASFCALAFQVGDTVRLKLLPDGPSGVVEYVQSGYTNGIGVRWPNGNRYPYEPEELEGRPEHVSNEESGETDKNT